MHSLRQTHTCAGGLPAADGLQFAADDDNADAPFLDKNIVPGPPEISPALALLPGNDQRVKPGPHDDKSG